MTFLTLELDSLQGHKRTQDIRRAQQIIQYLERIVECTRKRAQGGREKGSFNLITEIDAVVNLLSYQASNESVALIWEPPATAWPYAGEPMHFNQVMTILITNAVEAYKGVGGNPRRVVISVERGTQQIVIRITDWGKGIAKQQRQNLFKSFSSTKKTGMGLGLFIARQTIEKNLSGSISLAATNDRTEFIIQLPRTDK